MPAPYDVVIVGAGFTGLSAGLDLARAGYRPLIVERDNAPGGLAGTFDFRDGVRMEKFYHHWFNHDTYVTGLVRELGLEDQVLQMPSRTGMYYNKRLWRLSTPLDVLRFSALSLIDRIRLGLLLFQARGVKDWHAIESLSIREWLEPLCGKNVFRVVWEPLIEAKFSIYAEDVSAVWFWNKLVLRGGTRDKKGGEQLAYFKGGFGKLAEAMAEAIREAGGEIRYNAPARAVRHDAGRITALQAGGEEIEAKEFLFTPAFPVIADLFAEAGPAAWLEMLRRVRYLGNICLVLQLDRSLSEIYWLNVNDPGFPFVGVIEHTNFDCSDAYQGTHIVYLSRYLAVEDPVWGYDEAAYFDFALPFLKRMFPDLDASWVLDYRVWRTPYAQPVTERNYSRFVPGHETPFANGSIATMGQIYPEDRGTNYAIRDGRKIARTIVERLQSR